MLALLQQISLGSSDTKFIETVKTGYTLTGCVCLMQFVLKTSLRSGHRHDTHF